MAHPIARLPEILVNQIAAGEVVERPANVVKELVENSLDAGSRRIDISLIEGGMEEIAIVDNGVGIASDQLALAIERHTTSKIREFSDLDSLSSFGFRGEALSSIASVSEMEIRTRPAASDLGAFLRVNFGRITEGPVTCPSAPGTAITVRGIFSQVPARAKFLRSASTELSHCLRIVKELALGCPGVDIQVTHGGRKLLLFTSRDRRGRLREVLKNPWEPIEIDEAREEMSLYALLAPPGSTQTRADFFLFINGRSVRNSSLRAAVKTAYAEASGAAQEPGGVLFLDIRRDWVDVNVHPQKLEVRYLSPEAIYQWTLATLRKYLATPTLPVSMPRQDPVPRMPELRVSEPRFRTTPFSSSGIGAPTPAVPLPFEVRAEILPGGFFLHRDDEGLLIGEIRTFHAWKLWETLKTVKPIPSEPVAIPKVWRVPPTLRGRLAEALDLQTAGFEWEDYGDGDLALRSGPRGLPEAALGPTFERLLALPNRQWSDILCEIAIAATETASAPPSRRELIGIDEHCLSPRGRPLFFRVSLSKLKDYF